MTAPNSSLLDKSFMINDKEAPSPETSARSVSKINIHEMLNPPEDDDIQNDDGNENESPLPSDADDRSLDDYQQMLASPAPSTNSSNDESKTPQSVTFPPTPPLGIGAGVASQDSEDAVPPKPRACINCRKACKKCDKLRPCGRCVRLGLQDTCVDSPRAEYKKRGPKPGSKRSTKSSTAGSKRGTRRGARSVKQSAPAVKAHSPPAQLPSTDDDAESYNSTNLAPSMSRDPPSIESLSETVNASIRADVLQNIQPNWTKFDILSRLCHSVLVHHQATENTGIGMERERSADSMHSDQSSSTNKTIEVKQSSAHEQVEAIVEGLMSNVFSNASHSRKRAHSIGAEDHLPKRIAV